MGPSSAKRPHSSPISAIKVCWRNERVSQLAAQSRDAVATTRAASSEDLLAPLYVAWQITNECNLACLHCIEESGPGKAFGDELDEAQVFNILDQLMDHEVP